MLAHGWQTIPERAMAGHDEPFKFRRAPSISPERMKPAFRLCQLNVKSQHKDDKSLLKVVWSGSRDSRDPLLILTPLMVSLQRLKLESSNFARR